MTLGTAAIIIIILACLVSAGLTPENQVVLWAAKPFQVIQLGEFLLIQASDRRES